MSYTPPPASASNTNDLALRFAARLIDWIILGIVGFIIGAIAVAVSIVSDVGGGFGGFGFRPFSLISNLIPGLYFVGMEGAFKGQTVGKMLLKRRVVPVAGGEMDFQRALTREWWNFLYVVPFVGGLLAAGVAIYIAVGINSSGRGWHDEQADTNVVVA